MNKLVISLWGELPVYHKLEKRERWFQVNIIINTRNIMIIYPAIDLSKGKIVRIKKETLKKNHLFNNIEKHRFLNLKKMEQNGYM